MKKRILFQLLTLCFSIGLQQANAQQDSPLPVVKLSPQMRTIPLAVEQLSLPLDEILPFLAVVRIIPRHELPAVPRVIALAEQRLTAGAGDSLYVKALPVDKDASYAVFRRMETLIDEKSKKESGLIVLQIGEAKMVTPGEPATLLLTRTTREIGVDDYVLVNEENDLPETLTLRVPDVAIEGEIISVLEGVSEIGQYQVVLINQGQSSGLALGDLLTIFAESLQTKESKEVSKESVELPESLLGDLLVFRVFNEMSLGLVLNAKKSVHIANKVRAVS